LAATGAHYCVNHLLPASFMETESPFRYVKTLMLTGQTSPRTKSQE
jgi:hypothetical protein